MSLTGSGAAAPSLVPLDRVWAFPVGAPCEVADEICSPFSKMHRPGRRPPPPTKAVCVRKLLAGFRPPVFLEPL